MSLDRPAEEKISVLSKFYERLKISGYSLESRREIIVARIRTYNNKLQNKGRDQIHIYRNMENKHTRRIAKMSEKTLWYNKVRLNQKAKIEHKKMSNPKMKSHPIWVDAVMMVPRTPGGSYAKP